MERRDVCGIIFNLLSRFTQLNDPIYWQLFATLGALECAPTRHLTALVFGRDFRPARPRLAKARRGLTTEAVRKRVHSLMRRGFVEKLAFGMPWGAAWTYHLTEYGRCVFSEVRALTDRIERAPGAAAAVRGWKRAEIWSAIARRRDGWAVGQSPEHRKALQKRLGFVIPKEGLLPYDIIVPPSPEAGDLKLLVVDDLRFEIDEYVGQLPLGRSPAPPIRIVVRPGDLTTMWLPDEGRWLASPRFGQLLFALRELPKFRYWDPKPLRGLGAVVPRAA